MVTWTWTSQGGRLGALSSLPALRADRWTDSTCVLSLNLQTQKRVCCSGPVCGSLFRSQQTHPRQTHPCSSPLGETRAGTPPVRLHSACKTCSKARAHHHRAVAVEKY